MLAEPPLWLQEWSRSRNNAAPRRSRPDQNAAFLGRGPRPDYLRDLPRGDHVEEALKAFKATWSQQLERQIQTALKFIPADQYDIWIKVDMALKSLDWDRGDGTSIGFELWDEWSATCREKYSLAMLEMKWPTFNVSFEGQHVTIGTIFYLARQRGWIVSNQPNDQHKVKHVVVPMAVRRGVVVPMTQGKEAVTPMMRRRGAMNRRIQHHPMSTEKSAAWPSLASLNMSANAKTRRSG
jgi:hypothetical protein